MEEKKHPLFRRFRENPVFELGIGPTAHHVVSLYDSDTRRTVRVRVPNEWGWGEAPEDDSDEFFVPTNTAIAALEEQLDNLPHDTHCVTIDLAGRVVSFETDPTQDSTEGTDYPLLKDYQLPPPIGARTVLRSELTETRRICRGVDLVSYPPSLFPPQTGQGQDKNRFVLSTILRAPFSYGRRSRCLRDSLRTPIL